MNGDDIFKRYLAVKIHFTEKKYDCVKNNYQLKSKKDFKEKYNASMFNKLLFDVDLDTMDKITDFFISGFCNGNIKYIDYFLEKESKEEYHLWQKRYYTIGIHAKNQSKELIRNYKSLNISLGKITSINNSLTHPHLLYSYYGKSISMETLLVWAIAFNLLDKWENISENIIWPKTKHTIMKYNSFVKMKKERAERIIHNALEELHAEGFEFN
jgi:hypothetical protein